MRAEDAGPALAAELRAVAELLVTVDPEPSALVAANEHAIAIRDLLDGPPAARWYDGPGMPPASARAWTERSCFRGTLNPLAPPLEVERTTTPDGEPALLGRVELGQRFEGPPGCVHGGVLAGLFDDVLGEVPGRIAGVAAITGTLEVRYRLPTPLRTPLEITAWVDRASGPRVVVKGVCRAGAELTAQAVGLFVGVGPDGPSQ